MDLYYILKTLKPIAKVYHNIFEKVGLQNNLELCNMGNGRFEVCKKLRAYRFPRIIHLMHVIKRRLKQVIRIRSINMIY